MPNPPAPSGSPGMPSPYDPFGTFDFRTSTAQRDFAQNSGSGGSGGSRDALIARLTGDNYEVYEDPSTGTIYAWDDFGQQAYEPTADGTYVPAGMLPGSPANSNGGGGGGGAGNALGFAQMAENRRQFDLASAEDRRQFDIEQATGRADAERNFTFQQMAEDRLKRQQAIDQLESTRDALLTKASILDNAKMSRANLRETARQTNISATMRQFETIANVIPQFGQMAADESKRVQDILSSADDFIARSFESRGEKSPLAKVTQADQINALRTANNNLRQFMIKSIPNVDTSMPAEPDLPNIDFPTEAPAPAAGDTAAPAVDPATGQASQFPDWLANAPAQVQESFGMSPTNQPLIRPPTGPVAPAGTAGAGGGGSVPTGPTSPTSLTSMAQKAVQGGVGGQKMTPKPAAAPQTAPLYGGSDAQIGPRIETTRTSPTASPGVLVDPTAANLGGGAIPPPPNVIGPGSGGGEIFPGAGAVSGWLSRLLEPSTPYEARGYAGGGYTREPKFIVGEEKDGRLNRTSEMVVNPTNAPVAVVPQGDGSTIGPRVGSDAPIPDTVRQVGGQLLDTKDLYESGILGLPRKVGEAAQLVRGLPHFADGTGLDFNNPRSVYDFMQESGSNRLENADTGNIYSSGPGGRFSQVNPGYMSSANPLTAPKSYNFSDRQGLGFADMLANQFPDSPMVSQADLIRDAERALPPAVRDTLAGAAPRPLQSLGFRPLSMRQLLKLTPEEGAALGAYTRLKYNASPEFVGQQTERLFGAPRGQLQQAAVRGGGL